MAPAERAAFRAVGWMVAASATALPLLALPKPDDPLVLVTVHLSLLVLLGVVVAFHLAPLTDRPWFASTGWSETRRGALTGVLVIVLVTGSVGLVTLATSAALRYDPSLQFLQLLSALDIAWAAAALVIGLRRLWGPAASAGGAAVLGVVCVWAVWRYLDVVGFSAAGGWVVDGGELMRLVLPYDMGAAAVAVAAFAAGVRAAGPRAVGGERHTSSSSRSPGT